MSLHYSDESRKPRECDCKGPCPRCNGEGWMTLLGVPRPDVICAACAGQGTQFGFLSCDRCHGTGTVNADEEPDIETDGSDNSGWYFATAGSHWHRVGPFLTEADALAAARKAIRGESQ